VQRGIASALVGGALLVAGTALAQTAGPSMGADIVPLTGPSTAPGLPVLASPVPPALVIAPVPAEVPKGAGIRADASIAKSATASASPRKAVKVAHKPGPKATVKKASAPKRVAKTTARAARPKHVAIAKRPVPARQATVSAPIPLAKPQPSAKGSAAPKPVLPRV
jgi:hypothetical protein